MVCNLPLLPDVEMVEIEAKLNSCICCDYYYNCARCEDLKNQLKSLQQNIAWRQYEKAKIETEVGIMTAILGHGETILLIDDEQDILNLISAILSSLHYKVSSFTDTQKAYESFLNTDYDIVIADMSMKPISGIELLEQMKDEKPHIKTVLFSGYNENTVTETITVSSYDGYIMKPASRDDISSVLSNVLKAAP